MATDRTLLTKGTTFSKLTIVKPDEMRNRDRTQGNWYYVCKCSCGEICSVARPNLLSGNTNSCGCHRREVVMKQLVVNDIEVFPNHIEIIFNNCLEKRGIIDVEDYEKIKKYAWSANRDNYISANGYAEESGRSIRLHRLIMGAPSNLLVDHINHNPLDNRKNNLRLCNKSENGRNAKLSKANTSGVKGVSKVKTDKKWTAEIFHRGVKYRLGRFTNFEDACHARWDAEEKYHGKFASKIDKEKILENNCNR